MSNEGKLILAAILLVAGMLSFVFGDRELKVKYGVVTKVLFPRKERPYKGKLIGAGLCLAALLLLSEVVRQWV